MAELDWRSDSTIDPGMISAYTINNKVVHHTSLMRRFVSLSAPIFKALTIICIFIVSNIGYSPMGCKTQYLFSNKFWYNKQLVIFFIIYFVINLRSSSETTTTSPNDMFIVSIIIWILFNAVTRLGETWAVINPSFWPGPLTWFGVLTFPLITLFVTNDIRKYYINIDKQGVYDATIKVLYHVEAITIGLICAITGIGFYRSYRDQSDKLGKKFRFWPFFFGVESDKEESMACNEKTFKKYNREIVDSMRSNKQRQISLSSFIPELIIVSVIIAIAMFLPRVLRQLGPTVYAPPERDIKRGKSWKDEEKKVT